MSSSKGGEADGYTVHRVEHFRQRYNWDCGVSCVLMVLAPDQRAQFLRDFAQVCAEEGFGHSTWTIDLCYLLKRFGVKHHMYTTMMGVNEDYKKHGYYNKIIDLDRARVQRRFQQAASGAVPVSAAAAEGGAGAAAAGGAGEAAAGRLAAHVAARGPAIVLADAGLLVCDLCKHNKLKAEFRRCFGGGYKGHYILVVGYSARSNKFLYHDPALSPRLCALSSSQLHRAATAVGTDHDCILIYRDAS